MPFKLIDTHIHIWDFNHADYDWLKDDKSILNRSYSIEELNEERINAGISKGILVQAANNFEDTNWMLSIAASNDWIAGVVGWLPLLETAETEKALKKYSADKYFKGVRHLIHNEIDPKWLLQQSVIESLGMLVDYNLPYDIVGINTQHIETALNVAEKLPGLTMVFDHLNQPPIASNEQFGKWGELMKEAARHENVYVKISGLGTTANKQVWDAADLKPYIEFVIDQFGADRCFCGGDWPVSLLAGSYIKTWNAYKTILSSLLSDSELEKVYYENAKRFYKV